MAFKSKDLNLLAYANGFTWWHYTTTDQLYDVLNDTEYWLGASDMIKVGDYVCINANDGNTTGFVGPNYGKIGIE